MSYVEVHARLSRTAPASTKSAYRRPPGQTSGPRKKGRERRKAACRCSSFPKAPRCCSTFPSHAYEFDDSILMAGSLPRGGRAGFSGTVLSGRRDGDVVIPTDWTRQLCNEPVGGLEPHEHLTHQRKTDSLGTRLSSSQHTPPHPCATGVAHLILV